MPPTILNTEEWKDLISMLDSSIHVYSSSSFAEMYIPAEAARVTEEAIQKLSKLKNLTISYDGGTTKAVESIYTIHVTTPKSREAYLIEGSEKSGVSHTGPQIATEILKVSYITLFSVLNFNVSLRLWIKLANKYFWAYHLTVLGTQDWHENLLLKNAHGLSSSPTLAICSTTLQRISAKSHSFQRCVTLNPQTSMPHSLIKECRPFLVCVPSLNTSTSPHLLSDTSQLSRSMLTLRKGLFLSETPIS